ncbi:MAG: hypothetical protein ABI954_09675 [Pyrinomonadaceae bacterium]
MQNDIWQVEVKGKIYEGELAELEQWILDHALLPEDNVRRAGRSWIPAGQVPALQKIFASQAKSNTSSALSESLITLTPPSSFQQPGAELNTAVDHFQPKILPSPGRDNSQSSIIPEACHFHSDEAATFVCRECGNGYCGSCPKRYGTVRICPVCGEMCKPIAEFKGKLKKTVQRSLDLQQGYGFKDFGQAWAYPFKFWQSLCIGALFVALLSFGGFFGNLLANAILFGCIAQTINHMAHGDSDKSFMPDFDDFNVWDDVFKPFFLSIGVSLVAFLPLIIMIIALVWSAANSLVNQAAISGNQQTAVVTQGGYPAPDARAQTTTGVEKNNSTVVNSVVEAFYKSATFFILPLIITGLWALFYWPIALVIAGYTKSFWATINPLIGIDTMHRMGWVYIAAFFFCLIVEISSFIFSIIAGIVTTPFEMPLIGNLPAKLIISISSFYFSLVIAFLLGSALYKTSDRLGIEIS